MHRGGGIFRAADFHSRLERSEGPSHQLLGRHVPIVSGRSYQRSCSKLITPKLLAGHPSRTQPWQELGMDGRGTHTHCLLGGHGQGLRYCSGLVASRSLIAVRRTKLRPGLAQ